MPDFAAVASRIAMRLRYQRMARLRGRRYREFYLFPDREGEAAVARHHDPVVALTFDDGPSPDNDDAILAQLSEAGAKATFFTIGERVESHPEIVLRILASGHEIAGHGWSHLRMTRLSAEEQRIEIRKGTAAPTRLGAKVRWFRPPWGAFDETTLGAARSEGQRVLLWNLDSRDTRYDDASRVARRVAKNLTDGSVVCMHSNRAVTLKSLPSILATGRAAGVRFVTVSEWARLCFGISS